MPSIAFDRIYRYDDLTRLLHAYADEYPALVKLASIGKSHEGRDIWVVTLTNAATGPDTEKPALWVDGNLHATEVAASAAALYALQALVTRYGKDPAVTECLESRAIYLCPRVNPDGAEWALADRPRFVRSSTRPYPYNEDPVDGLLQEDLDGDGRILSMRIPDPNGAWKPHPDEARLLVRRDPTESGGTYYRVLPEGRLLNYDGVTIEVRPPKEGLDLNRNFPVAWRQEAEQPGAGPYPVSEPEARNLVDFILVHPNITGVITFHTYSGVLLRPYDDRPDEAFPAEDLWTYKKIGDQGTRMTGYPNLACYHEFRYHPKQVTTGAFDTWMYDHVGVFTWTVELWSPQRQAGIKDYKYIDWFREHPVEDDLKLLKWSDEQCGGAAHVDWRPFHHPQLGAVEIGGWDKMNYWRNPPPHLREREAALFPPWLTQIALSLPRLELLRTEVRALGPDTWRVRLAVANSGYLPAYVSKRALERKVVRGVLFEIHLPEADPTISLVSGKQRIEGPQLAGHGPKNSLQAFLPNREITGDRAVGEWVVRAPKGTRIAVSARADRAGVVRTEVSLD